MPAHAVQVAHVIRAIETHHGALDILEIEFVLIGGKRHIQIPVRLFLLELAAHLDG